MSGQAGRYQRSMSGMVGALLVSLLAIGGYVGFRALNRNEIEVRPEPIELADAVTVGDQAGSQPVYPDPLPEGWTATSFDTGSLDEPAWGLGLHTADGRFVGIRKEDASLDQLLETYVDESPDEGETVTIDSSVATSWQTWTDDGGDTAYASEVGEEWVLVYGSAPAEDLRTVVESLRESAIDPQPVP